MTRTLTFVLALVLPGVALAVPLQVAHQGELYDLDGPITDTVSLAFELFDGSSGGEAVWSELRDVDVIDGHYAVLLGSGVQSNPIEDVLALEPELWLQITVEGETLEPRQLLGSAPYAIVADTAVNVDGGTVNASSVAINGSEVINGSGLIDWDAISGAPADEDTLAGLTCANGARPSWNEGLGLWDCTTVAWGELQGVPPGFADGVDDDTTLGQGDVLGFVDGQTIDLGVGSSMGTSQLATVDDLTWVSLGGIPGGFADGVDDDALGALDVVCADGDRPVWNDGASAWECGSAAVGLDRLDTAGAATGDVLTYGASGADWEDVDWVSDLVLYTVSASGTGVANASCNSGDLMTGGGCDASGNTDTIESSYPSTATRWTCRSHIGSNLTVYAVCIDIP